jgi:hypothetical protein
MVYSVPFYLGCHSSECCRCPGLLSLNFLRTKKKKQKKALFASYVSRLSPIFCVKYKN